MKISPHYLHLDLLRYRCAIDLVPTERCAFMRLTFADSGPVSLAVDLRGSDAAFRAEAASGVVTARTTENQGGVPKGFATYYVVKAGRALSNFEVRSFDELRTGVMRFEVEAGKPVDVRIGTSFISFDQAHRNLKLELGERPFEAVRDLSAAIWEKQLGRILVEGGTESQRSTFYSALYRASLFPRMWHEPDGSGNVVHYSPYSGSVTQGVMYADHGYWDVYRAWYPLMSLIDPARLGEILQAWVNASEEGGWLPQFPAPGYRACMTGSLIDSVFGDAAAKQIAGFDLEAAYRALKKHATQPGDPDRGYGRRGIEEYLRLGYIPVESVEHRQWRRWIRPMGISASHRWRVPPDTRKTPRFSSAVRRTGGMRSIPTHDSCEAKMRMESGWSRSANSNGEVRMSRELRGSIGSPRLTMFPA
jgi:predicted alpha-1,2-mannosidase